MPNTQYVRLYIEPDILQAVRSLHTGQTCTLSSCYMQGGDCFDMSTVLCSLLLGAGFDAYVVTGYAPVAVTTSDQTGATCPMLEPEVVKKPQKMMPVASAKHPTQPKEAKYKIKSDDRPESTFLQVWCCFTLPFVLSVHGFLGSSLLANFQSSYCLFCA